MNRNEIRKYLIAGDIDSVARINKVHRRYVEMLLYGERPVLNDKSTAIIDDLENLAVINRIAEDYIVNAPKPVTGPAPLNTDILTVLSAFKQKVRAIYLNGKIFYQLRDIRIFIGLNPNNGGAAYPWMKTGKEVLKVKLPTCRTEAWFISPAMLLRLLANSKSPRAHLLHQALFPNNQIA